MVPAARTIAALLLVVRTVRAGTPAPLPEVDVVAPAEDAGGAPSLPGNAQSLTAAQMAPAEPATVAEAMDRRLASVHTADVQGNPLEPELSYRGFLASPALGTPIGLSVYADGVRLNESFGDVVLWDTIPEDAIARVTVVPGADPVFGRNTLGGAVVITTKTGTTDPGTHAAVGGGSFGRARLSVAHGGTHAPLDWFVAARFDEDGGWRERSTSTVRQGFGKLGWTADRFSAHLSYTFAGNRLATNGPTPESLLAADRASLYTFPDRTSPTAHVVNARVRGELTATAFVEAGGYGRWNDLDTLSGDVADDCVAFRGFARCLDARGAAIPAAVVHRARTDETLGGGTLRLETDARVFGRPNALAVGASLDHADTRFRQRSFDAVFGSDRRAVAIAAGTETTDAATTTDDAGVYATDTIHVRSWAEATAGARWNADRTVLDGRPATLHGAHRFRRLDPAAGLSVRPFDALGWQAPVPVVASASYSEGFRVPTPSELACASPTAPCALPGSLVADPPLRPVVARTAELGLRATIADRARASLALYQTAVDDEILFVNVPGGSLSRGFFRNVGHTRRRGLEASVGETSRALDWYAGYVFLDATYESRTTLAGPLGPVPVHPGDRIPNLPAHTLKLGADAAVLPRLRIGADLAFASSAFVRGDDANRLQPVPSHVVLNGHARWTLPTGVELVASLSNLSDAAYETYGAVNRSYFTGRRERFLTPGAPIAAWIGVRLALGGP